MKAYKLLYSVASDTGMATLNKEIAEHMVQGWDPCGPPVISGTGIAGSVVCAQGQFLVVQAMSKPGSRS